MDHIVIIGNGISGITAARHIRKRSNKKITVISEETRYFFSRTALMYIYMGHMRYEHTKPYEDGFWKKNRIELIYDSVEQIDTEAKVVHLTDNKTIDYDSLIIASGSISNRPDWPGQHLKGVQTLYSYPDLLNMENNTKSVKRAVIVGGGLIGVEMAEMLHSRKIEVSFLVREEAFWNAVLPHQEARLISRHIREHHIDLRLGEELHEIESDEQGNVAAVITKKRDRIPCRFVGLTVGVSPNIAFIKNSGIETKRGVLVNEFLQTNIQNVYAIGDCVERTYTLPGRKPVEQVWYTGRMMGEVVAQTLCGTKTKYEPGPWFNSAKFFDIEYQTYGNVGNTLKTNEREYYWEDATGKKAVHIVWDGVTDQFLGVNAFGIRMRHEKFDTWLRHKKSMTFVMDHWTEAHFDPEYFERYEQPIQEAFRRIYSDPTRNISAQATHEP